MGASYSSITNLPPVAATPAASPLPAASATQLAWIERGLERDLFETISVLRRLQRPTWLFVRGRRQVGKTQLVRKVTLPLSDVVAVLLRAGTVREDFAAALCERIPSHAALSAALKQRILKGAIIVVDEVQHADSAEQGVLQGVVDAVKGEVLHGRACGGGMILLGSHTQRVDDMNMGHGAPLWDRMTLHRTVLPFQPEEMAVVFARHTISSSRTRLYVSSLTGGYPAQLALLAQEGALHNEAELKALVKALAKHEHALSSVFEGELGVELSSVARKVVSKPRANDGLEAAKASLEGRARGFCDADLASIVERLQRYGIVRLLRPMFDLASRSNTSREQFVISDPRWAWYNAMRSSRAVQASDCVQDVLLAISASQVADIRAHMGIALEHRVAELIRARARLAMRPIIPSWTPLLDASESVAGLALDTCSDPLVLEGKQVGFEGELDGVVVFLAERIVVYLGCKLSSDALFTKELKPMASAAPSSSETSSPLQATSPGNSLTQLHAASLRVALAKRSPRLPDNLSVADEIADVLQN